MKDEADAYQESAGICPICAKRQTFDYRPFCSKRCSDVDLARWLKGSYAVPSVETDDPMDDAPLESENEA